MPVAIRPATPEDLPAAISLLQAAKLPVQDLTSAHLALVADDGTGILGVIGIESSGPTAMLRSLVVSPLARGKGIGRDLVAALESTASKRGARQLWLLTIDADPFFSELGFAICSRDDAPEVVSNSAEFSSLCPADAILMSKGL